MPRRKKPPELTFQPHIADYFVREHKYGVLEQSEITDTEHFIAEDQLWAFLKASQAATLKKLADDYGTDAREEVFKGLRKELEHTPLWMLFRQGLKVRGLEFRLFYPKPRSAASASAAKYAENRITFRPHFYYGDTNTEVDFVLFLNGLPIVGLELKHEANQNVHHAVAQFAKRDHTRKIFQHPFLYLAADTCDVMAATDPRREENFRWHNMGLTNTPTNPNEYPVEFLYREVMSQERLLEALSFFLVRVPEREAEGDKPERPASTIFPRYHQSRLVRRVAEDITAHFVAAGNIGKKYLADHSAGSGKTLSICWLADRLHSLFKPGTNEKLVDITFILTDRKSLDTNIREDMDKFTHLKDVVGIAMKADDLPRFLQQRKSIIVTTQQKFAWVLEEIRKNPELKKLRVAFLIDEAHRSQEGHMGAAIRLPFRKEGEPDVEAPEEDLEEQIARVIREHDLNQLFVAFTATPAPATVSMFGKPFDSYSEAEAIAEGYIVDVAASIISYKTLYNLHCPIVPQLDEEKLYPKGVVAKALQSVAFQDDGLIQYKAEVMLRIFEKDVKPLIGAKALSDQELLAILLGKGTPGMDVMALASKLARLIDEKGLEVKAEDLSQFEGVGDAKATLILAAIEFARRRIKPEGAKIVTPADLLPHIRHYADRKQEHFLCASINGANEILNIRVVSIGLIDRSPVHPREVFADALSDRASAVIVAHNHPSGSLEPSPSDLDITAQLKAAGAIVGIDLLDHIIFNRTNYFSFLEGGKL